MSQHARRVVRNRLLNPRAAPTLEEILAIVGDRRELPPGDSLAPVNPAILGRGFAEVGLEGLVQEYGERGAAVLLLDMLGGGPGLPSQRPPDA